MPKSTPAQLRAMKKWRSRNSEKYTEITRTASLKYYYANRELISEKKKLEYLNKKIAKEEEALKKINDHEVMAEIVEEENN
jgi:hypothetical protein